MTTTPFELPDLPWDAASLEPIISATTIRFHYGEHHRSYVAKLNQLVEEQGISDLSLVDLIQKFQDAPEHAELYNNAAQAWNHMLYWQSLTPKITRPSRSLREQIRSDFGDLEKLKAALEECGAKHFGSGWVWLTFSNGRLSVEASADADTPLAAGRACLLTIDVWEHAYYLDYQNRRADHLRAIIDGRLNWDGASERFEARPVTSTAA